MSPRPAPSITMLLAAASLCAAAACGNGEGTGGAVSSAATGGSTASSSSAGDSDAGEQQAACDVGTTDTPCNPFGVALTADALDETTYFDIVTGMLDAPHYRPPPVPLGAFVNAPSTCLYCDKAVQRPLRLVLVARNAVDTASPSTPMTSVDTYEKALGAALDRWAGSIAAVVIEDEVGPGSTSFGGTSAEYLELLRTGCDVAHARGARCANAGMPSPTVTLLLADYYAGLGNEKEALKILVGGAGSAALSARLQAILQKPLPQGDADVQKVLAAVSAELDDAKLLLAGYRAAGVDLANFHWLEPGQDVFDEVIAFMRTKTGCNAVMSDVLGQRGDDPMETSYKLDDGKELGLPLVIWWSEDAADTRSLLDPSGAQRPTGFAFELTSEVAECE